MSEPDPGTDDLVQEEKPLRRLFRLDEFFWSQRVSCHIESTFKSIVVKEGLWQSKEQTRRSSPLDQPELKSGTSQRKTKFSRGLNNAVSRCEKGQEATEGRDGQLVRPNLKMVNL
jgi:hypothetical protein